MQLGCCPATDARPAIALLQSEKPIDLLISDVVLPHISGRKLAELARNLHPHLKVLFVTGYAEQATIRSDFLDVGMDMLAKPFALDALGAKVHAMIQRPPSVAWSILARRDTGIPSFNFQAFMRNCDGAGLKRL
jgi:DNA-binding response OmpR family regulator